MASTLNSPQVHDAEIKQETLERQVADLQRELNLQRLNANWRVSKSFPKFAAKVFGYSSIVIAVFSGMVDFILDKVSNASLLVTLCLIVYLACWSVGVIIIFIADSKDWRSWNYRPMRFYLWVVDKCSIETPESARTWYDNKQCNYALLWGILVSPLVIIVYAIWFERAAVAVKFLVSTDKSVRYIQVMMGWIAASVTIVLAALAFGSSYYWYLKRTGRMVEYLPAERLMCLAESEN